MEFDHLSTIFRQVQVLVWKNLKLKFRHFSVLLFELLIPTAIIVGLWGIKLAINPKFKGPDMPATFSSSSSFKDQYRPDRYTGVCYGRNLVWSCLVDNENCYATPDDELTEDIYEINACMPLQIAVAPSDGADTATRQAVSDFMAWTEEMYPSTWSSPGPANYSTFVNFTSESEFLNYLQQPLYSLDTSVLHTFSSAIIFNSAAPNWDFSLRMNMSVEYGDGSDDDMISTLSPKLDLTMKRGSQIPEDYPEPYLNMFVHNSYFTLADVAHSFIATMTCRSVGDCSSEENVALHTLGGAAFPNGRIFVDTYWSALGETFALLLIIGMLYPLANITKALVNEKETKMREGMLMMALNGEALWISWTLHFLFLLVPLSIILTIASSGLFEYSDSKYIFAYFFFFFVSSMAYCMLVSVFFDKSRTASIVGNLFFFGGYFIYVGMDGSKPTRSSVMAACLHPAAAFTYGTLAFQEYEDSQIGVTDYTWDHSEIHPVTFRDTIVMMVVDTIILIALTWYFGAIWPSEFGTHRPWYFIFQPSYYSSLLPVGFCSENRAACVCDCRGPGSTFQKVNTGEIQLELRSQSPTMNEDGSVEAVPEALAQQRTTGECVDIRGLTKRFITPTGIKTAVDNLSLTMYSGQITSLLGHNGAGKTTLVAMLTGLFAPDSGNATIQGLSISSDMAALRKTLGVCPQHDILFPDLTVREHLTMFASFKGTPKDELDAEVEKMIQSVGLTEKRDAYSKTLSGGQKRKLSVGLAFVGNSKVVILDEPTSGMDPYSRRFTWNVIRQHREGRVVILITHFMDEADLLGDRIAIMGDGKLRCCGSSLFLKRFYGVGYNMTIEKANINTFNAEVVESLITSVVKEAKLLTNVGAELTFQLPFSCSHLFQRLFTLMDEKKESLSVESYGISVTTLEEVFIKIAKGTETVSHAEDARYQGRRKTSNANIEELEFSVNSSGSSKKLTAAAAEVSKSPDASNNYDGQVLGDDANDTNGSVRNKCEALELGAVSTTQKTEQIRAIAFSRVDEGAKWYLFGRHVYAMLMKRYLYFSRDAKTWIYQYVAPVVFVFAGVMILVFVNFVEPQKSLEISANMYNGGISVNHFPLPYANADQMCYPCSPEYQDCSTIYCSQIPEGTQDNVFNSLSVDDFQSFPSIPLDHADKIVDVSRALYYNISGYEASVFGAVSFYTNNTLGAGSMYNDAPFHGRVLEYVVHSNFTATFGGPVVNLLAAEGIIRTLDPMTSVTVSSHFYPLPLTDHEGELIASFELNSAVTFLLLGLSMLPASFAMNVVREREIRAKSQQMLSGVSITAYWVSTMIWDFASYQITVVLLMVVFGSVTKDKDYASDYENVMIFVILEMFGMAVLGFTYMVSFLFSDAATAQIGVLFINFIFGFALSFVGMVLRIIPSTRSAYHDYLRYIILLIPLCATGDALHSISLRTLWSVVELGPSETYTVHHWDISGLNMVMLAWEAVVYMLITIAIEYVAGLPIYQAMLNKWVIQLPEDPRSADGSKIGDLKDQDVHQEEERVRQQSATGSSTDTIVVEDAHKMYYTGQKYAVKGVSIGIAQGECFGLLGINGAGKTSLLSMLSGEIPPTKGEISLSGLSMLRESHACRKHIGFCPQFDALFDLLTAREHLALYARLKGIAEEDVEKVVDDKINEMGLAEYQNRLAGTYSGGNKRKLSVAIAMIGEPSIVFLDEPSTGMDPAARRFMWDIISDIVTKREKCCLILTTHSMEEAEALCTRVGIMVGGVMRCLGSTQHLRTRYGRGYQLEFDLKIPEPAKIDEVCAMITKVVEENKDSCSGLLLSSGGENENALITEQQLQQLLVLLEHSQWAERISPTGTGCDLYSALRQHDGTVTLRHFVSWYILEENFDRLCAFLTTHYESYVLRERHTNKIRLEISSVSTTSNAAYKLSDVFGSIETLRNEVQLEGYSVSQTTLEQIFNQFAAQQEEETGPAAGIQ